MAAIRIQFTPEDAERFDVPEVTFDPRALRFPEIRLLKNEAGMSLVEFGELCTDQDNYIYLVGVLAWLGLYRAGKYVRFEEFDVDARGIELLGDEADEDPNSSAPDGANES
ncbi:hypothetical protein [Micromonospora sp. DT62]|uniref:hypothetical protein n=1 Tax=Micromonospora sp. DT62 TaxID=3416521 RepID=UPI003CEE3440